MKTLFLIFNHTITQVQEKDAGISLGVERIISIPPALKTIWNQIPPDFPEIGEYLKPVRQWLVEQSEKGDYVLIQGDFGACFIMVNFAFQTGLVPVYSTTQREAEEAHNKDGSIRLSHQFKHVIFRKYEV